MRIIPIIYSTQDKHTDFTWMIRQSEYKDSLFLYNDNIESKKSFINGHGNASIREYNIAINITKPNPIIYKIRSWRTK